MSDAVRDEEGAPQSQPSQPQREWWDDPRLPWKGKPRRVDLACWASFCLIGIYGLATLPLRPVLLRLNPYALAAVSGSSIAMADFGAQLASGTSRFWWLGLLIGALSVMKFDWIFWWAGQLWGHGIIEVIAGRSRWAARTAHAAERLADRFGGIALVLAWFLPFVPTAVVDAFVGNSRMKLRTFLLLDFLSAVANRAVFFLLGYRFGSAAEEVVKLIAKYSTYLSIGLVVVIIGGSIVRSRRDAARRA